MIDLPQYLITIVYFAVIIIAVFILKKNADIQKKKKILDYPHYIRIHQYGTMYYVTVSKVFKNQKDILLYSSVAGSAPMSDKSFSLKRKNAVLLDNMVEATEVSQSIEGWLNARNTKNKVVSTINLITKKKSNN